MDRSRSRTNSYRSELGGYDSGRYTTDLHAESWEYDDYDRYDDAEREWPLLLVGGAMVAIGAWLLYQGARPEPARPLALPGANADRDRTRDRGPGLQVRESVVIDTTPERLYTFWRNFENLPRVMRHLKEVRQQGTTRSEWVAEGPLGTTVSWNAEITSEEEGRTIAWRSLPGSQVPTEGSVGFQREGDGTRLTVSLTYHPPTGPLGALINRLLGEDPAAQVRDDLHKFKQEVEAGRLSLLPA